ncbi:MAG: S1 RNA-binding domain-containing protein, partial [Rhodospirillaceae bacterium]
MSKRMLIDGAHPEEIRVVVSSGPRLDEYDIETTFKKQFKGNIYLAKVTRVEPSLQAAFVDFGGNRHGFLAFSEIHPDYYQIPIEDRQALIDEQEELELKARAAQEHLEDMEGGISEAGDGGPTAGAELPFDAAHDEDADDAEDAAMDGGDGEFESGAAFDDERNDREDRDEDEDTERDDDRDELAPSGDDSGGRTMAVADADDDDAYEAAEASTPRHSRAMRRYKIQEVIKRRQILLVQVVKEERGNKGAA